MPWAEKERVRAISGITVEQISDPKLEEIVKESDIRTRRMALYEHNHYVPIGTVWIGEKIQLPEDFLIADGNFDRKVDERDVKVYGCFIENGFLRKEELTVVRVEPKERLITLSGLVDGYVSLWIECWLNPAKFTIEDLVSASTMQAIALCCRRVYGKEGQEIANAYEEKAKEIIRKSLSIFI